MERDRKAITEMVAGNVAVAPKQVPDDTESAKSRAQIVARMTAQADLLGFKEALRLQREENKKSMEQLMELRFSPPPSARTHWVTWVAAVLFGLLMLWLVYATWQRGPH
jgi:hypothetical protein